MFKGGALDSFFLLSLFDAFALCAPVGKVMLRVQLPEASSQRLMLRYGFTPFAYTMNRESLSVCFVFSPSVYLYIGEEKRGTWCGWTKEITKRINTRRRRFGRGKGGMAAAKRTKNNNSFGRGEPKKRAKNAEWTMECAEGKKRKEKRKSTSSSSFVDNVSSSSKGLVWLPFGRGRARGDGWTSHSISIRIVFFGASAFEGRRGKASLVFVFFPPPSIAIGCGVNKKNETETTGIDARGHSPVGWNCSSCPSSCRPSACASCWSWPSPSCAILYPSGGNTRARACIYISDNVPTTNTLISCYMMPDRSYDPSLSLFSYLFGVKLFFPFYFLALSARLLLSIHGIPDASAAIDHQWALKMDRKRSKWKKKPRWVLASSSHRFSCELFGPYCFSVGGIDTLSISKGSASSYYVLHTVPSCTDAINRPYKALWWKNGNGRERESLRRKRETKEEEEIDAVN